MKNRGVSGAALFDLFKENPPPSSFLEAEFVSVETDSRHAKAGDLFVALKGAQVDTHALIPELFAKGVRFFVGEEIRPALLPAETYYRVPDTRAALARLASSFYGHPSHALCMIGVTGTSGKTTTTFLIERILQQTGHSVGLIGTVAFRYTAGGVTKTLPSTHTTPGPMELQKLLREMKDAGCDTVVMEVSSHALKQRRVDAVAFDRGVFLNLSPEHLDYHPSMEDYLASKRLLFSRGLNEGRESGKQVRGFLNLDHPDGKRLKDALSETDPWLSAEGFSRGRFSFSPARDGLNSEWDGKVHRLPLFGEFNAENLAAAFTVTESVGVPMKDALAAVESGVRIPGRLEKVPGSGDGTRATPLIFVDYAHKPDALEKVLAELKQTIPYGADLWVVFGCGGDRDRAKRPLMGAIAARRADRVVVTSDNPRTENPDVIIQEILVGMVELQAKHPERLTVESDRKRAIEIAVRSAKSRDWIVIAGKGHEDYQILPDPSGSGGVKKIHFDDVQVASLALTLRNQ